MFQMFDKIQVILMMKTSISNNRILRLNQETPRQAILFSKSWKQTKYAAKANHRATLRKATKVYLKHWKTLKAFLTPKSNNLSGKLVFRTHPASCLLINLMVIFHFFWLYFIWEGGGGGAQKCPTLWVFLSISKTTNYIDLKFSKSDFLTVWKLI